MFGKKKEEIIIKPKIDSPITYDGKNVVFMSFWSRSDKYKVVDDYIGRGYQLLAMAGMDGYIVVFKKPTKVMKSD